MEIVCGLSEEQTNHSAKAYRQFTRKAQSLVNKLGDLEAFLSDECLTDLKVWGQHPDGPLGFDLEVTASRISFRLSWDEHVTIDRLLPPPERLAEIEAAFQKSEDLRLTPVREFLGEDYSFLELALVRLNMRQKGLFD